MKALGKAQSLAAISARNLSFTYAGADKPSMENVNISIEKGEFAILTGPSGCGKTTLCRCLNGLIPNFYSGDIQGELEIDGLDTKGKATAELATHIGFVFQNPENQLFSLTVERDVAFGLENLGVPKEEALQRIEWAMEATGILGLRDKAPYELSGGQQQRAAIAGVLAMRPNILVLDEPTSFLDPKSAEEIVGVIAKLNMELGLTTLLVEHRLDLVSRYANRVIVMDKGKIALDGTPSEIYGDEARLIGIGLPRVTTLFHLLRLDGFPVASNPITVEQASDELRRLLNS
jgi:energy-coupling factor transporter ATP-binding protein EcfA2